MNHKVITDHFPSWNAESAMPKCGRKKPCNVSIHVNSNPTTINQSDPIPSEVSGSTDSTLERVPAIVSELIDLVAAIGLPVDVHKCMTKASLQLQCDPRGTAELQVHNSRCSWLMNYSSVVAISMPSTINLLVC